MIVNCSHPEPTAEEPASAPAAPPPTSTSNRATTTGTAPPSPPSCRQEEDEDLHTCPHAVHSTRPCGAERICVQYACQPTPPRPQSTPWSNAIRRLDACSSHGACVQFSGSQVCGSTNNQLHRGPALTPGSSWTSASRCSTTDAEIGTDTAAFPHRLHWKAHLVAARGRATCRSASAAMRFRIAVCFWVAKGSDNP